MRNLAMDVDQAAPDSEENRMERNLQMEFLIQRKALLSVPEIAMDEARKRCEGHGLDVSVLHNEWINDTLSSQPAYEMALEDVPKSFLAWVDRKIEDPFLLPAMASKVASLRLDHDAMRFCTIVWPQELAWAHRLRRSEDAVVAILSDGFLRRARKDVMSQFKALFPVYLVACEEFDYLRSQVHDLTPEQIRLGMGDNNFDPVFLRYARSAFESLVSKLMERDEIDKIVESVRNSEVKEVQKILRSKTAQLMERSRLTRMISIIRTAMDIGLDSDRLDLAYVSFLQEIENGAVHLDVNGGLPDGEFRAWLRVQKFKRMTMPETFRTNAADESLGEIVRAPIGWVDRLPQEYLDLGGRTPRIFQEWLSPIVKDIRSAPRDFVLDYGFHLVKTVLVEKRSET